MELEEERLNLKREIWGSHPPANHYDDYVIEIMFSSIKAPNGDSVSSVTV